MSDEPAAIATRLASIRDRITRAEQAAGRAARSVTLIAVSKTQEMTRIEAAIDAGQIAFGENRVQEARAKFRPLAERPVVRLHLIGQLQTNKAREAVALADCIEVLDRRSLAEALLRAADREGRMPELLVQVNVGAEPQKGGVAPAEADDFIRESRVRFGTALRGLMCVPPAMDDPAPHFRWLAACAARHGLEVVSMGMSADFETAIACGATMVRVGSAIFGTRLQARAAQA